MSAEESDRVVSRSGTLADLLTLDWIMGRADSRSFERGAKYQEDGFVQSVVEGRKSVSARVIGARPYTVKFHVEKGNLEFSCTCPWAGEGNFCKHMVAAGLAWLERNSETEKQSAGRDSEPKRAVTIADVQAMLAGKSQDQLIEIILEQASQDHDFGERLATKTLLSMEGGRSLPSLRETIRSAFHYGDFLDRDDVPEYVRSIQEVLDAVEDLIGQGRAAEVIELAEFAIQEHEDATEHVDDYEGDMESLGERLYELHLKACRAAKPEPAALAQRLFDWELQSEPSALTEAVKTYADILGPTGLASYRRLAEAEWAKVPAKSRARGRFEYDSRHFRLARIMELLAKVTAGSNAKASSPSSSKASA